MSSISKLTKIVLTTIVWLCLGLPNVTSAQKLDVSYELSSRKVFDNQPIQLIMRYEITDYIRGTGYSYKISDTEDFTFMRAKGESSSMKHAVNSFSSNSSVSGGVTTVTLKANYTFFLLPQKSGSLELPDIEVTSGEQTKTIKLGQVTVSKKKLKGVDSLIFGQLTELNTDVVFYQPRVKAKSTKNDNRIALESYFKCYFEPFPEAMSINDTLPIKVSVLNRRLSDFLRSESKYTGFKTSDFFILDGSKNTINAINSEVLSRVSDSNGSFFGGPSQVLYFYLIPRKEGKLSIDLGQLTSDSHKTQKLGRVKIDVGN